MAYSKTSRVRGDDIVHHLVSRRSKMQMTVAWALVGASFAAIGCTTTGQDSDSVGNSGPKAFATSFSSPLSPSSSASVSGETGSSSSPVGLNQDLVDATQDPQDVARTSDYRLLEIPGLGEFYVSDHLLKDIRKTWANARLKLRTNPHDAASLRVLAVHELALGNPSGAKTYLNIARSNGGGQDAESSLLMALAELASGNRGAADSEFSKAALTSEGYALAHLNRGMQALSFGSALQAAGYFSAVVAREPRNIIARLHLGQAYYLLRSHDKAVAEFDRVLEMDRTNALALYNRGVVLHRGLRKFGPARDSLERLLASQNVSAALKVKAAGALRNLDRDAQGRENLATIGAF